MSASISRVALALLLAGCLGAAAAQDKPVDVDALKVKAREGSTRAMRQLAEMYYSGSGGVEQDFKQALGWYQMLANRKDRRGMTALGTMYARGYGVEKNLERAHALWTESATSAKGGDAGAMYNLGTLYYRGEGVAQDYKQAAEWYRKAANIGHVLSQKNLAGMYWEGKGIEKSAQWSYYWFRVASLLGDDVSQESLKVVGKAMTAGEIRDAESQANDWLKKYRKIVGE